jgi:hypothetical protein
MEGRHTGLRRSGRGSGLVRAHRMRAASLAVPVSLTFGGTATSTTDLGAYTLSVSVGSAPPAGVNRVVVIGIIGQVSSGSPTISSVTIGGNSASFVASSGLDGQQVVGFAWAIVNAGTSLSCVVTFGQTQQRCRLFGYGLTGVTWATPPASAYAFASTAGGVSGATQASITMQKGGASILLAAVRNTSGFSAPAGQGTLTENNAATIESAASTAVWSEASTRPAVQTYSATAANTANSRAIGVIHWR